MTPRETQAHRLTQTITQLTTTLTFNLDHLLPPLSTPPLSLPSATSTATLFSTTLASTQQLQSTCLSTLKLWTPSSSLGPPLLAFLSPHSEPGWEAAAVNSLLTLLEAYLACIRDLGGALSSPETRTLLDSLERSLAVTAGGVGNTNIRSVAFYLSRPLLALRAVFNALTALLGETEKNAPDYPQLAAGWSILSQVEAVLVREQPELERITHLLEYAQILRGCPEPIMAGQMGEEGESEGSKRFFVAESPVYFSTVSDPLKRGLIVLFSDVAVLARSLPEEGKDYAYAVKYWIPLGDLSLAPADVLDDTVLGSDAYVDHDLVSSWSAFLAQGWAHPVVASFDPSLEPIILGFPLDEDPTSRWWDALQSVLIEPSVVPSLATELSSSAPSPTTPMRGSLGSLGRMSGDRTGELTRDQKRRAELSLRADTASHEEVEPILERMRSDMDNYTLQLSLLTALIDVTVGDFARVLIRENGGIPLVLDLMEQHDMHPDLLTAGLALLTNLALNPLTCSHLVSHSVPERALALMGSYPKERDVNLFALRLLRYIALGDQEAQVAMAFAPFQLPEVAVRVLFRSPTQPDLVVESFSLLRVYVALQTKRVHDPLNTITMTEWFPEDLELFVGDLLLLLEGLAGYVSVLCEGFACIKALMYGRPEWKDAVLSSGFIAFVVTVLSDLGPSEPTVVRAGARVLKNALFKSPHACLALAKANGMSVLVQLGWKHRRASDIMMALVGAIVNGIALEHNLAVLMDENGVSLLADTMNTHADVSKTYGTALTLILRALSDRPDRSRSRRRRHRRPSFDARSVVSMSSHNPSTH